MGTSRRSLLGALREKISRSSIRHETIIVLHTNTTTTSFIEDDATTRGGGEELSNFLGQKKNLLSEEDIAATKIQSYFRGHLARRALRALRSLVKLQAVFRGVCVRRQARIALHCMHALARLQITVRARQLLSRCAHDS